MPIGETGISRCRNSQGAHSSVTVPVVFGTLDGELRPGRGIEPAGFGHAKDVSMGQLYDVCQQLMQQVEAANPLPIDQVRVKGQIAAKAGFMVSLVSPKDADDPAKIASVKEAARSMGISL